MNMNINAIISGLDKLADELAQHGTLPEGVEFFRQAAYTLRTTLVPAKVWYTPAHTCGIEFVGVNVAHMWDSVEEFFDEADWIDFGEVVKMDRSLDISPVWAVLVPTAHNEDGSILSHEVRTFASEEQAAQAYAEAMKEHEQ